MKQYIEDLMADYPDDPPGGYTNPETVADYDESENTHVGRDGRTEAKASLDVGAGAGAPGKGFTSNTDPTDKAAAVTGAMQPQPVDTAKTPIQPAPQIPAAAVLPNPNPVPVSMTPVPVSMTAAQQDMMPPDGISEEEAKAKGIQFTPVTAASVAPGTAPVAQPATGQVSLSGGGRQPYFYNQSGQFSSGNQSLQGLKALGELGLNPNMSTFQKAIAGVQAYENGGQKSMPLDKSGNFVQGWNPEDYNNLIDWTKVEGIGRPIDVSKKEDRDAVQNWLGARFGAGLNNMHVDDKFGPYHVAAILEAAGQGGDNTPTPGDNTPPPPERPNDPEEPTPDPYRDRYEEYLQKGLNPLLAYIGDEPKAIDTSRLRAIMSAHALGEGLRSIADVIHGPKGAPITEHKNNVTDWSIGKIDEAVRQFNSDKKEHRQMKLNALMTAMNAARQQSNADRQDWRQSIAQMYDRFDKKVDRQDRQYKEAWDRYNTDRQFRQQADQFAATLEQQGLNRKQAKELSIMQMNHAAQMQREQFAHQKQMQDDAIAAGRYSYRGGGTDGGNRRTDVYYHKASENGYVAGANDDAISYKLPGTNQIIKTHPALADDVIAHMQSEIGNENVDRRVKRSYQNYLAAMGIKNGNVKQLTRFQRQRIIHDFATDFFTPSESGWTPIEDESVQSDSFWVDDPTPDDGTAPAARTTTPNPINIDVD